jgi:hypothetical protein
MKIAIKGRAQRLRGIVGKWRVTVDTAVSLKKALASIGKNEARYVESLNECRD